MSKPNYESIASTVFPELDADLVPYVASILEENAKSSADDLNDMLCPILIGYEVCSEEEIAERCKKLQAMLQVKETPKKCGMPMLSNRVGKNPLKGSSERDLWWWVAWRRSSERRKLPRVSGVVRRYDLSCDLICSCWWTQTKILTRRRIWNCSSPVKSDMNDVQSDERQFDSHIFHSPIALHLSHGGGLWSRGSQTVCQLGG